MAHYIDKDAIIAEIEKLMNRYDSGYDKDSTEVNAAKGNVCHEILCTIGTLEVKDVDLEGTEIIHESMLKALENYKVSSELFDVATEYIRNTLPRFNKKFPVKSNEISAAIFFGANWERQRIIDKVCWCLNNNRIGVIDDDYINKLRKELED